MQKETEEYLSQRASEGLADATISNYRHRLKLLAAFLNRRGIERWQDVRSKDLDAYMDAIRKRYAFSTRDMLLWAVKVFFAWLAERGRILSDPSCHLELKESREDRPLMEPPLEEDDVADLIASMPRGRPLDLCRIAHIELLYSGGMRLSESLSLDVSDVDMARRVIHLRRGKGSKPRDIPMMKGLQAALKDYLVFRRKLLKGPDHGALLLNAWGHRVTKPSFDKFMKKLNAMRGLVRQHLHAHLFRHSIAVHLLRGGADIRYIQAFLGHESLDTTRTYLRLVPADIREAYLKAMPSIPVKTS